MEAWHQERTQVRKLEAFIEQIALEVENKVSKRRAEGCVLVIACVYVYAHAKVVGLERMTSTQCTCSLYHVLPFLNGDRLVCFEEITNLEIDTIAFLQSSAMARLSSERGALEETNTQLQDLIDQGNSEKQVLEQRLAQ
eukprot:scaffold184942_cov23-Tisochrysis_lutea.AAC.1